MAFCNALIALRWNLFAAISGSLWKIARTVMQIAMRSEFKWWRFGFAASNRFGVGCGRPKSICSVWQMRWIFNVCGRLARGQHFNVAREEIESAVLHNGWIRCENWEEKLEIPNKQRRRQSSNCVTIWKQIYGRLKFERVVLINLIRI